MLRGIIGHEVFQPVACPDVSRVLTLCLLCGGAAGEYSDLALKATALVLLDVLGSALAQELVLKQMLGVTQTVHPTQQKPSGHLSGSSSSLDTAHRAQPAWACLSRCAAH